MDIIQVKQTIQSNNYRQFRNWLNSNDPENDVRLSSRVKLKLNSVTVTLRNVIKGMNILI